MDIVHFYVPRRTLYDLRVVLNPHSNNGLYACAGIRGLAGHARLLNGRPCACTAMASSISELFDRISRSVSLEL